MSAEDSQQSSSSTSEFELLSPLTFAAAAIVGALINFGAYSFVDLSPTALEIGEIFGRSLGALLWPWLVWLLFRAIKGKEKAPNRRRFVLGGALILIPLITVTDVIRILEKPTPSEWISTYSMNECHRQFDEFVSWEVR